jgi:hypothetical protein
MRYFKPEILRRSGSLDDDVADAASEEWQAATAAYRAYLTAHERFLPVGAREVDADHILHDGKVLSLGVSKDGRVSLVLHLRDGTGDLLRLDYVGARVTPIRHALTELTGTAEPSTPFVLYHEFEAATDPTALHRHRLLCTGGLEFEIAFSDLEVTPLVSTLDALAAGLAGKE